MKRLYVIVRGDLDPGDQLAQAVHAACTFSREHDALFCAWHDGDNNLVVLSVPTEHDLGALLERARVTALVCSEVHEPDLSDELTAIAVDDRIATMVSSLPLALRWTAVLAKADAHRENATPAFR